ncbi:MAG TPA: SDR family NAD(P)-dependent oxidoreductase, partial [Blastocatellia bacterium]|nr:SDR family NAD(P)-dependent oxidoreductase [Blastocatellia bacterium]
MTTDAFDFDFNERALEGRVVLVAGGTGGLGSATVALLARDGATVVAGYRGGRERAEALKQAVEARYKATVHLVEGDISDPEARARYVEAADALGKGLYAMICFTGDPARVRFEDVSDADLHASMQENYVAPVLLARAAGLSIRARGAEGAIVLLSTMQAVAVFESSVNYAGPKTALIQAARIM